MNKTDKLLNVILKEKIVSRSSIIENERSTAVRDLIVKNKFKLVDKNLKGPYLLVFSIDDLGQRINADVQNEQGDRIYKFTISLKPFRRLIKDYMHICESYYNAMRTLSAPQIETIDMARRGIHNEGADLLQKIVESNVNIDYETSRRLFTLITVMHIR